MLQSIQIEIEISLMFKYNEQPYVSTLGGMLRSIGLFFLQQQTQNLISVKLKCAKTASILT